MYRLLILTETQIQRLGQMNRLSLQKMLKTNFIKAQQSPVGSVAPNVLAAMAQVELYNMVDRPLFVASEAQHAFPEHNYIPVPITEDEHQALMDLLQQDFGPTDFPGLPAHEVVELLKPVNDSKPELLKLLNSAAKMTLEDIQKLLENSVNGESIAAPKDFVN